MKNLTLLILLISTLTEASTPVLESKKFHVFQEKNVIRLSYRTYKLYQLLLSNDFKTIDNYIEMFYAKQNYDKNATASLILFVKIIIEALEQNKIPMHYIKRINHIIVAMYNFNLIGYDEMSYVLWLSELNSLKKEDEIIKFIEKVHLLKSDDNRILKVLKHRNMYIQIQSWYKNANVKNLHQLITLLKRRFEISKAFERGDENVSNLLLLDYKLTIEQAFKSSNKSKSGYASAIIYEHNDWLFLQFHKHKNIPKIRKILKELEKDWLVYNENYLIGNLPIEKRYELLKHNYSKLDVFWKIKEINNTALIHPVYSSIEDRQKKKIFLQKYLNVSSMKINKKSL